MLADWLPQFVVDYVPGAPDRQLWLLVVAAIALLVYGADRAVSGAVRLATAVGMPRAIIGATVVSLGTTAPETTVSVTAAFAGSSGLALGNGIGSIICNAALIFGLCTLIKPPPKDLFLLRRHGRIQLVAGASLAVVLAVLALARGGIAGVVFPRTAGVVFVGLLVAYLIASARWARQHPEILVQKLNDRPPLAHRARLAVGNFLLLAVGLALVIVAAKVVILVVSELCLRYHVPPNVLAVTLVAFGTSLPELVTGLVATAKGHPELLVGNILGANILNCWFVIGASAVASPLPVSPEFYWVHVPIMMAVLLLMGSFMLGRAAAFRRWQGGALLAVFVGYYALLLVRFVGGRG